jgi:lactate permease
MIGILLTVDKRQVSWAMPRGMLPAIVGYGSLAVLMLILYWPNGVQLGLSRYVWQAVIPEVSTNGGFVTPTGLGQAYRFFLHPGFSMIVIGLTISLVFPRIRYAHSQTWKRSLAKSWKMGLPVSVGILFVLGVSAMMDYCGMTQLLAEAFADTTGDLFPIVSPLVGMLGAFTTGSNTSSNVLFAPMQVAIAGLLGISPTLIAAAQTTGGSLGSMIAPAKIAMGCATIQHQEKAGEVLRITLLPGIGLALLIGLLTFVISRLY